ncbi:taurine catabolism dioxygenase TauD [Phenylobacterium hankyongense]|uniref:Taurine catabolism dioxygenase TauD n=1 Tax=Phenylobacterium hankyongense TaxID=1813876 RepID=A0A328AZM7_9CAUL|nr:TauD/TfdA family dioxygenase [Phenylobacterium hankyongense]RAK59631.1 taurine catabolism dioxygenase TauD [Phenylobacterium hankyongense]
MHVDVLETACEWSAEDVRDPARWTEQLSAAEIAELEAAIARARDRSSDLLDLGKADFPLPTLGPRLRAIETELMDGRGFVLIRGLPRERWTNDDMCLAYWGIGAHLGKPWPQNAKGHVLGDVTDQGKQPGDPTARGNELGQIGLDYHCDGSDLVGLLCLQTGVEGGLSAVCNSVALHNRLVRERPELAAELYQPQPYDYRGEQPAGKPAWYSMPVFTRHGDRLFVRLIRPYILASQRHAEAPRLTDKALEALTWMQETAESGRYAVTMDFRPGDMQFINNYHVLHGRTPYRDDRAAGRVRHLKRLWLETDLLADRPSIFTNRMGSHWAKKLSVSRLDAAS